MASFEVREGDAYYFCGDCDAKVKLADNVWHQGMRCIVCALTGPFYNVFMGDWRPGPGERG